MNKMSETILNKILASKRRRVASAKAAVDTTSFVKEARRTAARRSRHRLRSALETGGGIKIIAEFKRASPSKGFINGVADPASAARAYASGGACAVSVLTEEDHFGGSLDDLASVRSSVDLPILRKDFIFDEFQVFEAVTAGADAVLLITAMLRDEELRNLRELIEDDLGLDALIEVHSADELERAEAAGAKIIGINNRDLRTFEVSLDVSRRLIRHAPKNALMVAESGIGTHAEIDELRRLGFSGFLIGETLMRSENLEQELTKLIRAESSRSD